jgi:Ankyrin repeats (3 copies)
VDAHGWTNASYIWARRQDDGNRSQDCLKLLLSECCPALTSYDAQKWTVLHRAASFGSAEDVNLLLKSGANPLATVNTWTPAFYAICLKNFAAVPQLARLGFNINYQDNFGWTLLHLAVWTKSKSVMECLFKLNADPHIKGVSHRVYWKECHCRSKPSAIFERDESPLDLARNQGEETFNLFVQAAQDAGLHLTLDVDEDVFWDAKEDLSLDHASPS